jgi:hypothetical protein
VEGCCGFLHRQICLEVRTCKSVVREDGGGISHFSSRQGVVECDAG